jgi:quinol monooxygenase YgiN
MIVRIFDTAMDPDDIERATQLFRDQVIPAFEAFDGCESVEMTIGVEEHSGDLVDIASISRWTSMEAVRSATATKEYGEALQEIRKLFQRAPLVRHFEVRV